MTDRRDGPHRTDDMNVNEDSMTVMLCYGGREIGEVSFEWEVCPTCRGGGSHVNPNIDRQGIDPAKFRRDPEFAEQYFSGSYDQTCSQCSGRRVVPSPTPRGDKEQNAYEEFLEAKRQAGRTREIQRQERRMARGRRV